MGSLVLELCSTDSDARSNDQARRVQSGLVRTAEFSVVSGAR